MSPESKTSRSCCMSSGHVYLRAAAPAVQAPTANYGRKPLLGLICCRRLTRWATGRTATYHIGTRRRHISCYVYNCSQIATAQSAAVRLRSSSSGILLFTTAGQWLPSLGRRQSTTKNSGHCCSLQDILEAAVDDRRQAAVDVEEQRPQLQDIFEAVIDGNHV